MGAPITTAEIVLMVLFGILLGVTIFWFVFSLKDRSNANTWKYSRGANATSVNGEKVNVSLSCDADSEICMWQSTLICTSPGTGNTERSPLPAFSTSSTNYGGFDPTTTVDLTADMAAVANGKQSVIYEFDPSTAWSKAGLQGKCAVDGGTAYSQLISTYTCIPKGTQCKSFSS